MGSLVHVLRTEDSIVPVDKELELQEAIIYRGLGAFEEMGNALIVIRDQRLYRSEFPNFEIYTQNRLELSRRYVDFLINAASIMAELRNENFSSLPTRETHVRPLSRLSREERINVWNSVVERVKDKGKVTASLIKEVIEEEKKKSQDDNSQAPNKILLSKEHKAIAESLICLSQATPGTIREAVISRAGETLMLPECIQRLESIIGALEI